MNCNRLSRYLMSVGAALALTLWSCVAFGLTAAAYLPLAPGNTWTYLDVDDGVSSTRTKTVSANKVLFNGTYAYELVSSTGSKYYELNDQNGSWEFGGYSSGGLKVTFSPSVQGLPPTFDVGQAFSRSTTATYSSQSGATASGPVTWFTRVMGFEYVTVPAGTFYAVRLDSSMTMTVTNHYTGATITLTGDDSTWLAENVGEVKSVTSGSDGTSVTSGSSELLQYSLSQPVSTTTTTTTPTTTTTTTTTTTVSGTTTTTLPSGQQGGVSLALGWNLVGNSNFAALDVATAFGDPTLVYTVWKWNSSSGKWAFYAPGLGDGGAAYAASKGYEVLTTINGGEGFWVNAKQAFSRPLPDGAPILALYFLDVALSDALKSGWNLISIGDVRTPSQFNAGLLSTPPVPGVVQNNLTTLWAWDNALSKWYFYAPSLEAQGGTALADYIASKGYLNFTAKNKTLGPGVGFWVNKP